MPHYFLISPSFPFWKTSLILYYRIWISELRVCSSKYQNPSFFQGDSFLTILRRNTFPLLVPTETIRKQFLIVSKSKFQESFLAPLPLSVHTRVSLFVEGMRRGKYQDLIFVTDIRDYIRGEKSVMWRTFRFL